MAPTNGVLRSWIGKALSANTDIAVERVCHDGVNVYAVDGTPADCVQLGIYGLLENKPDIVVSGINIGDNVGQARALTRAFARAKG